MTIDLNNFIITCGTTRHVSILSRTVLLFVIPAFTREAICGFKHSLLAELLPITTFPFEIRAHKYMVEWQSKRIRLQQN